MAGYTRSTSREAYDDIQSSGLVNDKQRLVYNWLFEHGPATAGELTHAIKRDDEVHPSYHRRLDELSDVGAAQRIGERHCKITGRNVTEWDVTDRFPEPFHRTAVIKRPKREQFRRSMIELGGIFEREKTAGRVWSDELVYVLKWLRKESEK